MAEDTRTNEQIIEDALHYRGSQCHVGKPGVRVASALAAAGRLVEEADHG